MARMTAIVRKWEVPGAKDMSNTLIFDGVIRETHGKKASISKNPMETGVNLADHAIMEPDELTLEIAVSNRPLRDEDKARFAGNQPRSASAWAELEKWMAAFVPFDVVTGLKTYKSLLITSMSTEQDKDSSGALYATVQLQQVLFASTTTVVYPARASEKPARQASKAVDHGKKNAQAPTAAQKKMMKKQAPQCLCPPSTLPGKGT